jgi:Tfp pilus assembly protein PilX
MFIVSSAMRRSTSTTRRATSRRNGAFLVVAMICLVLSTVLVGAVLTLVRSQHRQMVQEQLRLQAEWLAESGLERAVSQLHADSTYTHETWSIAAGELGGGDAGAVTIRIEPVENQPQHRIVHVEAVYPTGSTQAVRRTRQTTIVLFQES